MQDYLVHVNFNHDKKGRFDFGDGDHDGQTNDRENRGKGFFKSLFDRSNIKQGRIKVKQFRDKTTWSVQGDPKSIEMAAAMVDLWSKANL